MSLSRWSNSDHYIYVVEDDRLQVCGFGHFTTYSILNRYPVIERRAKRRGYGLISRLELRIYLRTWAKARTKQISWEKYWWITHPIYTLGHINTYLKDPYYPNKLDSIYSAFREIKWKLVEKLMPKYHAKRREALKAEFEEWKKHRKQRKSKNVGA